jgi:hypothetical protein
MKEGQRDREREREKYFVILFVAQILKKRGRP